MYIKGIDNRIKIPVTPDISFADTGLSPLNTLTTITVGELLAICEEATERKMMENYIHVKDVVEML